MESEQIFEFGIVFTSPPTTKCVRVRMKNGLVHISINLKNLYINKKIRDCGGELTHTRFARDHDKNCVYTKLKGCY